MKKLLATILALVMALPLCTVSWAAETQDVAEAGGTKYESLQDAINAADGQTVKLLDNVTVVGSVTEIPAGTKVTLDLNGKTLTGTNTPTKEQALLVNGELVIVDSSEAKTGTIKSDYTGTSGQVVLVASGGKLTMAGGKITTEGMAKAGNAVKVAPGAVLEMTDGVIGCDAKRGNKAVNIAYKNDKVNKVESWGTFVMTGGAVIADGGDGSVTFIIAVEGASKCAINIGGSSIVAGPEAVSARSSNVSITGGDFTGAMTVKAKSISGGTFSNSVDPTYLADGLKYEVCAGGKYSYYSDFDTAAAAAAADGHEVIKVGNSGTGVVPFYIDYADGTGVKPKLWMSKDNFELPTPTRSGYTFKGWKIALHEGEQIPGFTGTYTSEQVKDIVFAEAATDGGAINRFSDGAYLTAVWSANSYYYYSPTSDTTTSTTTKGSPKTFDAGVGIYAVTAVLSVTGMAWTAKKRH